LVAKLVVAVEGHLTFYQVVTGEQLLVEVVEVAVVVSFRPWVGVGVVVHVDSCQMCWVEAVHQEPAEEVNS
jgi:hypothetical protein